MSGFFFNNVRLLARISSIHQRSALQNPSRFSSVGFTSISKNTRNQRSFVVDYLVNSCGLTPKSALSASKHVNFKTPNNPDLVLSLFRDRGFSESQISQLVKKFPQVLIFNPERSILPKLEYLHSQGLSWSDIAHYLSVSPYLLSVSLKNGIVPSLNFIRKLVTSDKFLTTLKSCFYVLNHNLETALAPKLDLLRDIGVPEPNILNFIRKNIPSTSIINLEKLEEKAKKAEEMGFNPSTSNFVDAVSILMQLSESTWAKKVNVYKRWDWSEEDIVAAFRKHPNIMGRSEDKIVAAMDLFVNKLGWESLFIAKNPALIGYSLEKRLIPRASVLQFLLSKGLLKMDFRSANFFKYPEADFLLKFLNCYEEAAELLKFYHNELVLSKKQKNSGKVL